MRVVSSMVEASLRGSTHADDAAKAYVSDALRVTEWHEIFSLMDLAEATDAKLDPVLLKDAQDKLKVAELAQRVYAKAKAPPGKLAIDVLQEELEVVGGGALAIEIDARYGTRRDRTAG